MSMEEENLLEATEFNSTAFGCHGPEGLPGRQYHNFLFLFFFPSAFDIGSFWTVHTFSPVLFLKRKSYYNVI